MNTVMLSHNIKSMDYTYYKYLSSIITVTIVCNIPDGRDVPIHKSIVALGGPQTQLKALHFRFFNNHSIFMKFSMYIILYTFLAIKEVQKLYYWLYDEKIGFF